MFFHRTALYLLVPIRDSSGEVFWGLFLGFMFGILSIPFAIYMLFIERQFNISRNISIIDQNSMKLETNYLKAFRSMDDNDRSLAIFTMLSDIEEKNDSKLVSHLISEMKSNLLDIDEEIGVTI